MRQVLKAAVGSLSLLLAACGAGSTEPGPAPYTGPYTIELTPSELEMTTYRCYPVTLSVKSTDGTLVPKDDIRFTFDDSASSLLLSAHSDCAYRSIASNGESTSGTTTFYVKSEGRQKGRLTVSSGEQRAVLNYVSEPAASQLTLEAPRQAQAGECVPVLVSRSDSASLPVSLGSTPFQLSVSGGSEGVTTHADKDCQGPLPERIDFPKGQSSVAVYVRSTKVYSELNVRATLLDTPRIVYDFDNIQIVSLAAEKVFLRPQGTDWAAGDCVEVAVYVADKYDNPAPFPGGDVPVQLTSSAGGAVGFFRDFYCLSSTTTGVIPAGTTSTRLYARGLSGGEVEVLAATQPPLKGASTRVKVASAVHRGTCTLEGSQYVTCPLSSVVSDTTRTFFTFQATSALRGASATGVRCYLSDNSTLTCSRKGGSGSGRVNISWQLVQLAEGARVWHLNGFCDGETTRLDISPYRTPFTTVYPEFEHSFVLFSSEQTGAEVGSASFATAVLKDSTQVEITNGSRGCAAGNAYSVQVVDLSALRVTRGVSDATSGAVMDVTTPTSATAAHSLVLATHQASEPSTSSAPALCNRMLRGEVLNDTTLRFSRSLGQGCTPGLVTRVSWERLTAEAHASLRSTVVTLQDGELQTTAVLEGAMDPARTLLLSSSQSLGGQGAGETRATTGGLAGVAQARFTFAADPSQVTVTRDTAQGSARWSVYALQLEP